MTAGNIAFENICHTVPGAVAAADLSAAQYLCVAMTSTGFNLAPDDAPYCGVLQDKPAAAGRACCVAIAPSVTKVVISEAITKGDYLAPNSTGDGKVEKAESGDPYCGIALTSAGADGDLVTMQLASGTVP